MLGREKLATFCMHSASGVRLIYTGWGGPVHCPLSLSVSPTEVYDQQGRPSWGGMTDVALLKFQGRGEKSLEILYNVLQWPVGHDQRAYRFLETSCPTKQHSNSANTTVQDFIFFTIWAAARTSTWNSKVTTYGKNLVHFYAQNVLKLTYQHLNPPPQKKFRGFRLVYKKEIENVEKKVNMPHRIKPK